MAAKRKQKKQSVNKTTLIKEALQRNPDMSPKELAATLNKKGVKMSAAYVSTIKTNLRKKGLIKGRKQTQPAAGDEKVLLSDLKKARQVAAELGGVAKARKLLDYLTQLGCL